MKTKEGQAKVLVVIPTADRVEAETTRALKKQTYKNFEVLVNKRPPAIKTGWRLFDTYFNCTANMNDAREQALKTDAEFFWFVDSDIVPPPTALAELVLQNKPVVGGWYRIINDRWYVAGKFLGLNVLMNWDNVQTDVVRAGFVGHGCMLVQRRVLETLRFRHGCDELAMRFDGESSGPISLGACGAWGVDCLKAGFEMFMQGNVHCGHKDRITGKIVK